MPWEQMERFRPCCKSLGDLLDNFPYYTTQVTEHGIYIYRAGYRVNVFTFCPFCAQKIAKE